ncbi:hypothetical protein K501DRAFT_289422 [Backusella circina FSU 941]|nr:hypothetical protein K501DRAFT_289422 [Backusella circina FSU 941]
MCSRCVKLKKSCIFDPNFKRISTKSQIQHLKKELKLYKHALNSNDNSNSTLTSVHLSASNDTTPSDKNTALEEPIQSCASEKTLGTIVLLADKVTELFEIFFEQCYPYLSFTISRSIETVYNDCSLLFWVICNVASIPDQALHSQLYPQVQRLVSQVTLFPARQIEILQALLITSLWPFPSTSLLSDSSYLLCGLAIHIGLQIGLHRPERSYEFSSKQEVLRTDSNTRRATWLSCYSINYWHSSRLGVPSTFVEDAHFISMIENPETSESLSRICKVCRLASAACVALGADIGRFQIVDLISYENRLNMIKMYITELTSVQLSSRHPDASVLEVMFLGARLQIFSFALVDIPSEMESHSGHYIAIDTFYQAETNAIKLIDIVDQEIHTEYAPVLVTKFVIYATLVLLWILRSKYANNKQQIAQSVTKSQALLVKLSRYERDEPQRAVTLISSFSRIEQDRKRSLPVRSRMSATLLYESIRVSKENSNEIVQKLLDSLLKGDTMSLMQEFNL